MQRFESSGSAERFFSMHAAAYNTFNVKCHQISRRTLRTFPEEAMAQWQRGSRRRRRGVQAAVTLELCVQARFL